MPTTRERMALWGRTIFRVLGQNRVSQAGVVVTTAVGISMVFLWVMELLRGGHAHPYAGIILFFILPGLFVFGLLLIPAGFVLQRRRDRKEGRASEPPPPIDLSAPKIRRVLTFVALATLANATLVGFASYKGLEVMDSVEFCGEACHSVMAPELAAYPSSMLARMPNSSTVASRMMPAVAAVTMTSRRCWTLKPRVFVAFEKSALVILQTFCQCTWSSTNAMSGDSMSFSISTTISMRCSIEPRPWM